MLSCQIHPEHFVFFYCILIFSLRSKSQLGRISFRSDRAEILYSKHQIKNRQTNRDRTEFRSKFGLHFTTPWVRSSTRWWILGFRCWGGERWRGTERRGTGGWPGGLNRPEQSQRKSPLTGKHWLCNWLCEQGLWLQQQRAFWEDRPIPLHLSFSKVQLMAISLQSSQILLETFELDWVRN